MLALNSIPGCDFSKCVQWTGRTSDGTTITAGMTRGAFDLIGLCNGRRVDLDGKTGSARLSKEQLLWQKRIRRAGGVAESFHSVDEAVAIVKKVLAGEL